MFQLNVKVCTSVLAVCQTYVIMKTGGKGVIKKINTRSLPLYHQKRTGASRYGHAAWDTNLGNRGWVCA